MQKHRGNGRPGARVRRNWLSVCWLLVVIVLLGIALSLHEISTGKLDLEFTERLAKRLHLKYSKKIHHVDRPILEAAKVGNTDDIEVLVSKIFFLTELPKI